MVIRALRFNTYLLLAVMLVLAVGCQTAERKRKKQIAVVRVHIEVFREPASLGESAVIGRNNPIEIFVHRNPILTEDNVTSAEVIEVLGGFALQIKFDRMGTLLLEQYTASNPRKRLAVFCQFGEDLERARWLAAPMISQRISTGTLTFTPDADREETDQIALGLNNHAAKTQPKSEKP